MLFDVVSIFPGFFDSPLATGLLGKAGERGLVTVRCHDLRAWTHDRHRTVDDAPFGGGAGMVMLPAPWFDALDDLTTEPDAPGPAHVVLLAPDGRRFDQPTAARLARMPRVILCCGRYEGVDERVRTRVDEVLSIGDYVLAGGETAALVVVDAVARLVPGVMGNAASAGDESFATPDVPATPATPGAAGTRDTPDAAGDRLGLLEYPQYTRPASYRGLEVPEVLRSGDHGAVARWRRAQAVERTRLVRPDLLAGADLTDEEHRRLADL
ncbi:MAG TPA: tRNA (guanosine(37)-N1)-methyltransferase TrmD [Actinomycetes bacterium]|nr:tRNA (guanosine(37)-N1)-methyltransferase TrmD [Actinomycetes bacterium]